MEAVEQEDNSMNNQSLQGGDSSYMPPPANDKTSLNNDASAENPMVNEGTLTSERKPLLIEQQRQQNGQIQPSYGLSSSNPNQFYTVTVDVYKAARINSILSELNFSTAPSNDPQQPRILLKIEQEDTVIQEIKKREVAYRKKLSEIKREEIKRRKIEERETQKKIEREKKQRYQQPRSYTSTQYQQQVNEAIAKQENKIFQESEQEKAFTVEAKIEKKSSVDLLDENKNQEDSKNDSHVDNQVSLQIENPNLEENQNMGNELNSQDNDIKNLSPTPRKSERDKQVKNYKDLQEGRMSAEEEANNPLGQTTINLSTGNPLGPQASKTPSQRNLVKTDPPKVGKNVTLEKTTELLDRMKNHRFAHLFNNVKDSQQTLVMINLNLKIGKKYTNTTQIGRDMREMVMKQIEATLKEGKNDEYQQIVQFLDEFDEGFKNLENLSLVKGPEVAPSKPKPNPTPVSTKVTQPVKFNGNKPVTENKATKKEPQPKTIGKPAIPQTTPVKVAQQPHNGANKNEGQSSSGIINISTSNVQKMTQDEIDSLKDKINNKLNPEQQRGIVEIIKKDPIYQVSLQESGSNGQLELDLDKLTPEVARELEVYVNKEININNRRIKRQAADKARRQRQQAIKQQKQQLEKQRDQQPDASKQDVTALAALQATQNMQAQLKVGQVMPQGQVMAGGQTMGVNPLNQVGQLFAAAQLNGLNQIQLQNAAIGKGQNIQPNQAQLQQLLLQQQIAQANSGQIPTHALQNIMNQQVLQKVQMQQVQPQVPAVDQKEEDNESSESSSDDDSD